VAKIAPGNETAERLQQHQLSLAVQLRDDATLENFLPLPKAQPLLTALQGQMQPGGDAVIYLYGPPGAGKSHLLQASCHLAEAQTLYLPLAQLRQYPAAEVLQGVEQQDRVCLDDIHSVLGDPEWELALFSFYNSARQHDCRLVVAAHTAPRSLAVNLPDLRSRLSWGIVYQLKEADDEEKAAILQFRAMRRGLTLSPGVASFIVGRAPRGMQQLLDVLDRLDCASLAEQRALSIPFVKQALGW
jgi:DnaA-homolog protein